MARSCALPAERATSSATSGSAPLRHPARVRRRRGAAQPVTERARERPQGAPAVRRGGAVRVASARNQAEGELLQGMLLEEGVPSLMRRSGGFDVPDFLAAGPRDILVPASGAEAAADILRSGGASRPPPRGVRAPGLGPSAWPPRWLCSSSRSSRRRPQRRVRLTRRRGRGAPPADAAAPAEAEAPRWEPGSMTTATPPYPKYSSHLARRRGDRRRRPLTTSRLVPRSAASLCGATATRTPRLPLDRHGSLPYDDARADHGRPRLRRHLPRLRRRRLRHHAPQATSRDDKPVFVGVARTADADRYLEDTRHTDITDVDYDPFDPSYRDFDGKAPARPASQDFWAASPRTGGHPDARLEGPRGQLVGRGDERDGSAGVDTGVRRRREARAPSSRSATACWPAASSCSRSAAPSPGGGVRPRR